MKTIREADWKRLRDLKPIAIDRFCTRVLLDLQHVASDTSVTSHERYATIYDLIHEWDKELAKMFDGLSRSNADWKFLLMYDAGLLTEDEVTAFSDDIRSSVARRSDF